MGACECVQLTQEASVILDFIDFTEGIVGVAEMPVGFGPTTQGC